MTTFSSRLDKIATTLNPKKADEEIKDLLTSIADSVRASDEEDDIYDDVSVEHIFSMTTTETKQNDTVVYELWEALAYDIALGITPIDEICKGYNITTDAFAKLQQNPYFSKILATKRKEVQEVGDQASTITQFRMIATSSLREFNRRLKSVHTSDKDFHALFRTALEIGRLIPTKAEGVQIDVGQGSGATINVFGIPGLEHLASNAYTPIEPTPLPTVIDSEYTEITTMETL